MKTLPTTQPSHGTTKPRLNSLDAHRGLIMILMAVDHASYYIAHTHSAEFWGMELPVYPDALWFWTRWITHLCAPGFFLLMGAGMALFSLSRQGAGWSENRITKFFMIRGLFLIALQFLVENQAWRFGDLFMTHGTMTFRGGVPGAGSGEVVYLGVLFGLGATMVFWSFMRRFSSPAVALISLAAIFGTQFATPDPNRVSFAYSPLLRILIIPGYTNGWTVFYPVIPWLGVTGLGLLFGRLLNRAPRKANPIAAWAATGCVILFVLVRSTGTFGNLTQMQPGWMGFLNVVKYPPSLSFLSGTLAVNFILIALLRRLGPMIRSRFHPLLVFGRAPLFFYLAHLWVFVLLGLFFPRGSSLTTMYLMWLLALAILYPLCYQYARFKSRRPVTSLWRFL